MYKRSHGNRGRVERVEERPIPPPPVFAPPPPPVPPRPPGSLTRLLGQLLPGAREPLDEVEFLVGVFAGAHHEQAVLVHPAATLGHEPESVVEGDGPVLAVGFEKGL